MSRDAEDEDLGEQRRLRQASQFQKHITKYGDRAAARAEAEREEAEAAAAAEKRRTEREQLAAAAGGGGGSGNGSDEDDFKPPPKPAAADDEPTLFGKPKPTPSGGGAASAAAAAAPPPTSGAAPAPAPGPSVGPKSAPSVAAAGSGSGSGQAKGKKGKLQVPAFVDGDGTAVEYVDSAAPTDADAAMRQFFPAGFGGVNKRAAQQQKQKMDVAVAATSLAAKKAKENKEKAIASAAPNTSTASGGDIATPKQLTDVKSDSAGSLAAGGGSSAAAAAAASDSGSGGGGGGDDDDTDMTELLEAAKRYKLPITHEVEMAGHDKTVAAISVDPSGARVLTGSYDYTVKFYDFAGMNEKMNSFRSIEPEEGHQIRHLAWSITGDSFLVATGSARPKIYNRDGFEMAQFIRGDMYIMDAKHTKGHLTAVTGAVWHPTDKNLCLTSSIDGTLRIWDVHDVQKNRDVIKYKASAAGQKAEVTAGAWAPNGSIIAGAATDGSISLWNAKTKFQRADKVVLNAHKPHTDTSGLTFSADCNTLLSRGCDNTLKIWDVRQFKTAVHVFDDLENYYSQTNAIFAPDANSSVIVTGTSNRADEKEPGAKGNSMCDCRVVCAVVVSGPVVEVSVVDCGRSGSSECSMTFK